MLLLNYAEITFADFLLQMNILYKVPELSLQYECDSPKRVRRGTI